MYLYETFKTTAVDQRAEEAEKIKTNINDSKWQIKEISKCDNSKRMAAT